MTDSLHNIIKAIVASGVLKFLIILLPIFFPLILIYTFWVIRFRWLTLKFVTKRKPGLLRIKLPKEITKSPAAMEIFFTYFSQSGAGNYSEAFLDGKIRPWFSCEMISVDGEVEFFIWMSEDKYKTILQTQLYAHYPNLEIYEVPITEDYTRKFMFDTKKYKFHGLQYKKIKPEPYPIKTYINYGLDKDQKDEYKIDPLNSVIEFLGSMKKGENAWIQILIRKHEKEGWKHGLLQEGIVLKDEIKKLIEKIRKESVQKTDDKNDFKFPNPTKGQTEVISDVERNAAKIAFDCMIRGLYVAEHAAAGPASTGGLNGCLRQFTSNHLNGFKTGFKTDISDERKDLTRIFPIMKGFNDRKIANRKRNIFHAYKLRAFFEWPFKNYQLKPFIMSTEELATLFHFPSGVVSQTPTLSRIGSKKSEAPSNLPL